MPLTVVTKDGSGAPVALTENYYDGEEVLTYDDVPVANAPLPDWTNPGTTTPRGNMTRVRRYYDLANSLYLEMRFQYDQCGNTRSIWNERNIQSQMAYSADYRHAYATQATTAVPDLTGAHASNTAFVSSSTYDYTSGQLLSATDSNGQVTLYSYLDDQGQLDPLHRLRKLTRPDGGWTKTRFNDTVGNLYVYTESAQDATHVTRSYQYFDAMGRPNRSYAYETGTTYLISDTQYDQMGRVSRVSSPYRGQIGSPVNPLNYWTTTTYDSLGRETSRSFSDTTTTWSAQTTYLGASVTVTDQALRKRRQQSDALGRIVRLDEPDSAGSLDTVNSPVTTYQYDVLGNLTHITQGSNTSQPQHRYFKYDALSRLLYQKQAEQSGTISTATDPITQNATWSTRLVYDETINGVSYKGLVTSMYDARGVQTQYQYDQLNRVTQITYSDGTPALTNNYDQVRAGYFNKSKLTETTTAATVNLPQTSQVYDFDLRSRVVKQTQSVGTNSYTLRYAYNLASQLVQEVYPSGRTVNFNYDEAARLSQVNGGSNHIYIGAMSYTPHGALAAANLGNDVNYTYGFNTRLQPSSISLTRNSSVLQKYEYKYGAVDPNSGVVDETKNAGQVARIESWIGTQKQWQQRLVYDSMGRLSAAGEYRGDNSQQSYLLNYDYDLFGNRFQRQTRNSGNPFVQKWVELGEIDLATNRYTSGVTYDYAGNVTSDPRFRNLAYQYDANGRQKQSSASNGTNPIQAVFDGTGQRVALLAGNTLSIMVYDAMGKLVAEYGATAPTTASIQYVMADHQGSTRVVTDTGGNVLSRHDYQPFGEEIYAGVGMRVTGNGFSQPDSVRQKFAMMEQDEATGMAHTLWRKYDGTSGRWTSPDPYGGSLKLGDPQSFNRYSYVNNDPVNHLDPTGLALEDIGVLQTSSPYLADKAEQKSRHEFEVAIAIEDFPDDQGAGGGGGQEHSSSSSSGCTDCDDECDTCSSDAEQVDSQLGIGTRHDVQQAGQEFQDKIFEILNNRDTELAQLPDSQDRAREVLKAAVADTVRIMDEILKAGSVTVGTGGANATIKSQSPIPTETIKTVTNQVFSDAEKKIMVKAEAEIDRARRVYADKLQTAADRQRSEGQRKGRDVAPSTARLASLVNQVEYAGRARYVQAANIALQSRY
ncbi:MAG: RHS repeat protein [Acidobacteria bacterium]|nr:RHS repeat protein [Acidobacteriota bacterium]